MTSIGKPVTKKTVKRKKKLLTSSSAVTSPSIVSSTSTKRSSKKRASSSSGGGGGEKLSVKSEVDHQLVRLYDSKQQEKKKEQKISTRKHNTLLDYVHEIRVEVRTTNELIHRVVAFLQDPTKLVCVCIRRRCCWCCEFDLFV